MEGDLRFLTVMLIVFWGVWWVLAVVARRSYIPVIPLVPLTLAAAGHLLNVLYPWVGTSAIAALHLALLARMARDVLRRPPSNEAGPQP